MKTEKQVAQLIVELKKELSEIQEDLKNYRNGIKTTGEPVDEGMVAYCKENISKLRGQIFILEWILL